MLEAGPPHIEKNGTLREAVPEVAPPRIEENGALREAVLDGGPATY